MVTVRTQIKELVKTQGINNTTDDFHDALNTKVQNIVTEACDRAKKNLRKTVMARDI